MNLVHWTDETVFGEAIEIEDPAARTAFLDRVCDGDSVLRQTVDQLLSHHDNSANFLESPLCMDVAASLPEQPGDEVDKYRLLERIGEGGFGVVYRAEQQQPVRRLVALKIGKLGMATAEFIERFEAERQTMGMLSHPNIAAIFDAGETPSGRPYFAMELVDGQPVDAYCDDRGLTIPERLKLFLGVCRAIQHAHHKGLVHRDLKPSNILVATVNENAPGVPKVIDFGLAKAIRHNGIVSSIHDDTRPLVGSPAYMSPEQFNPSADIDTRTDIYALGGVLYKLLTGVAPLDDDTLRDSDFERLARTIRDVSPPPPSERGTPSVALRRALRGDLDWIVGKALAKDRSQRYDSVGELARDIERYLDDEPVLAAPPSRAYLARKFVRRNRILVVATGLVLIALVAGSVAATVGLVRANLARHEADALRLRAEAGERSANEQRRIAAAEADKAQQVVALLEELLGAAHPERGHAADYTVRQLLDDSAEPLLKSLAEQPEVEATLQRTVGRAYWHLGDMQRAGPHLERALELRQVGLNAEHPEVLACQTDFAMYLVMVSRFEEADRTLTACLAPLRAAGDSDALVTALLASARIHDAHARYTQAAACTREAWDVAGRLHGERGPDTLWAAAWHLYSVMQLRDRKAAETLAREIIALQTEVLGADHAHVGVTKGLLGIILQYRGALVEAERVLREALDTHTRRLGRHNRFVATDLIALAGVVRASRRPQEAETLAREAVAIAENVAIDREYLRVRAYHILAMVVRLREREESLALYTKAIELQRSISTANPILAELLERRGTLLREFNQPDEAQTCYREGLEILRNHQPDHPEVALHLHGWANSLRQLDRLSEAEPLLREAAETCPPARPERPVLWLDWIDALLQLNRPNEARAAADRWFELERQNSNRNNRVATGMVRAMLELADGNVDAAEASLEAAANALGGEPNARAQLRLDCLLADCLVRREQFAAAEKLLLAAEQSARTRNLFQADELLHVLPRLARVQEKK